MLRAPNMPNATFHELIIEISVKRSLMRIQIYFMPLYSVYIHIHAYI